MDTQQKLAVGRDEYTIFSLPHLHTLSSGELERLPYSHKVLLENVLRKSTCEEHTLRCVDWFTGDASSDSLTKELDFYPTRVMLHDVSGIPLIADLAAMREHLQNLGRDPRSLNPTRPVDFIMDHSVIVDHAGTQDALSKNVAAEFARNAERYRVAKWAGQAFDNVDVRAPGEGICHQINLEQLARVVWSEQCPKLGLVAFPDSLVACDSHTPMVNALSVLGWGVGAIEGLSAMLGEPVSLQLPEVVGVHLTGALSAGVTTTDLALALTATLRAHGVVQKFVEYFGPGLDHLTLAERATIANMAPEYGATVGFFPTDDETLAYLRSTGRSSQVALVERYCKHQGLWRDDTIERTYSQVFEFDLSTVQACVAGPKLPQSRVALNDVPSVTEKAIGAAQGSNLEPNKFQGEDLQGEDITDGDIVIAAITSCTNTSNPSVMVAAGLLAKNARERGLTSKSWVKTSLSPGSRKVTGYLSSAGLLEPLEGLGFHVTGYGCMTCCGGSGALNPAVQEAIQASPKQVAAVLSGNRNFEGRIHPSVDLAYLASPPLVIAYAMLGTTTKDITSTPLGLDTEGKAVYLKDIWPTREAIEQVIEQHVTQQLYAAPDIPLAHANSAWSSLDVPAADTLNWDDTSTYIVKPPFLETAKQQVSSQIVENGAVLAVFGDQVTTDHISPGSRILEGSLAGDYLAERQVSVAEYSSFLQRRSNHEVMKRATFNNTRIQNEMTPHIRGGWTVHQPSGDVLTIFAAHERYAKESRPLVVIAGKEYGTGSSRDWAAKGPHLLGVDVIIAESFERIHRANLVGMGILPLQFQHGESRMSLGLDGSETVDIFVTDALTVGSVVRARFEKPNGETRETLLVARLDTQRDVHWYRSGGVMPYVLQKM